MKNKRKVSFKFWPGLFFVAIPFLLSLYFIRGLERQEILIKKEDFPYKQYIIPTPDINSLGHLITKTIGASLYLDWYDVCLKNNAYIELNNERIANEKLEEPIGNLWTDIYPIEKNQTLKEWYGLLKELNIIQNNRQIINTTKLLVRPGKEGCIPLLTEEGGFIFEDLFIQGTKNSASGITMEGDYYISDGDNIIRPKPGDSKFFIKTNNLALWSKRFVFILLLDGIFLLILEILDRIFVRKEIKTENCLSDNNSKQN